MTDSTVAGFILVAGNLHSYQPPRNGSYHLVPHTFRHLNLLHIMPCPKITFLLYEGIYLICKGHLIL